MTVGIIGSRNKGEITVETMWEYVPKNCNKIISGGAVGIDSIAEELAHNYQICFEKIVPNYKIFGKIAPLVRNTEIVKKCDKVLAFWDYQSSGTAHAIRECIRLEIPIQIISILNYSDTEENQY